MASAATRSSRLDRGRPLGVGVGEREGPRAGSPVARRAGAGGAASPAAGRLGEDELVGLAAQPVLHEPIGEARQDEQQQELLHVVLPFVPSCGRSEAIACVSRLRPPTGAPSRRSRRCPRCGAPRRRPRAADPVDHRPQAPVGQARRQPRGQIGARSAFSSSVRARRVLAKIGGLSRSRADEVDLGPRAAHHPDQRDAPQAGERAHVLGPVRRAHQVEDHVRAAPAGGLAHRVGEAAVRSPRPRGRPGPRPAGLLGTAHGADDRRTHLPRHLDRRRAHAARGRVHQQGLARREPASAAAATARR